jgi:PPM family protein phosphatase
MPGEYPDRDAVVTPSIPVRHAALTDVGVKRSHNQDACSAQPAADEVNFRKHGHIFVVADGMGGHAVGEKASAKAVRDIPMTYQKHVAQDGVRGAIKRAFTEANAGIFEIGQKNPEFQGMGTTATALFVRPDGVWVGHVGDSRAYRIRAGKIEQLTFDHSWVWEIARRQGIDPDTLGDFKKNVIIRSLGPDAEVEVDVEGPYPVRPGDFFLLCSDGLSNQVPADEIGAVVSTMPPADASKFLIELANVRGGPDNITCLIVQIPMPDGGTAPMPALNETGPGPGKFRAALRAWDQFVPWSFTFLGLGILAASGAVGLKLADLPGAIALFAGAAGLIVAGIVGLVLQFTKKGKAGADGGADSANSELHFYKGYQFEFTPALVEKIGELGGMLSTSLKESGTEGIDWPAHKKWYDEAAVKLKAGDAKAAFKAQCRAVALLASAYNKDRSKDEAFQPNW